jgi:putative phosphoribosyl transferase
MRAALRGVRRRNPKRLVMAVPVAPQETIDSLRPEVDDVVCLSTPEFFAAIGEFYEDFRQTSDKEVTELLDAAQRRMAAGAEAASSHAATESPARS